MSNVNSASNVSTRIASFSVVLEALIADFLADSNSAKINSKSADYASSANKLSADIINSLHRVAGDVSDFVRFTDKQLLALGLLSNYCHMIFFSPDERIEDGLANGNVAVPFSSFGLHKLNRRDFLVSFISTVFCEQIFFFVNHKIAGWDLSESLGYFEQNIKVFFDDFCALSAKNDDYLSHVISAASFGMDSDESHNYLWEDRCPYVSYAPDYFFSDYTKDLFDNDDIMQTIVPALVKAM